MKITGNGRDDSGATTGASMTVRRRLQSVWLTLAIAGALAGGWYLIMTGCFGGSDSGTTVDVHVDGDDSSGDHVPHVPPGASGFDSRGGASDDEN